MPKTATAKAPERIQDHPEYKAANDQLVSLQQHKQELEQR